MRMRSVLGAILLGLCSMASAADWSPHNQVAEEKRLGRGPFNEPDHLVPISNLAFDTWCVAGFAVNSAFSDSDAQHWCLRISDDSKSYSIVAWSAPQDGPDGLEYFPPSRPGTSVTPEIAQLIREIWINALLQARFPRFNNIGLDGVSFEFYAKRFISNQMLGGSTWSPYLDLPPLWLTEIGEEIYRFGTAADPDVVALRKALSRTKKRLYSYLRKKGI
jgi:hypothetical protein